MHPPQPALFPLRVPGFAFRGVAVLRWVAAWLIALVMALGLALPARADGIQLSDLHTERTDEGLLLSFSARFELTRQVEDALLKGLPVYFEAEVTLLRKRWYWRDERSAHANRTWRLAWQPLTRRYRVTLDGLHQNFETLGEALAFMRGASGWRIAEPKDIDEGGRYYIEFSYKLDTSQLPRTMQIGLGAPQGWGLSVEQMLHLAPDFSAKLNP